MSLAKLDNSKNPKIVILSDSALNYIADKEKGTLNQKSPKTAAINVIREAGKVSAMDLGSVQVAFKTYGKWQNYFVDRDEENGTITMKPCENPKDRDGFIYINITEREDGKGTYYAINEKTDAGKKFVQGLGVRDWVNENSGQVSSYIEGRVTLKNDALKEELMQKGEGYLAILSKNGFEVKLESELNKQNKELHEGMAKEGEQLERTNAQVETAKETKKEKNKTKAKEAMEV